MIFSDLIIHWYKQNSRELPWRNTLDPYKIWISEVILQQTKVSQGLPYYLRFIDRFPTVDLLSRAKEEEVLKLWQGLGYYSRARHLHYTSKRIVEEYNSVFPNNYNDILNLKGVGEYTAAAISSFAYNLPFAVLDGNVSRVLSRYLGIEVPVNSSSGKKILKSMSQKLLNKKKSAEHNQAIMEFGALYCIPRSPDCYNCVLKEGCKAYEKGLVQVLPIKNKSLKVKIRYFNYLIITQDKATFLQKRRTGIWKSLFEFPLIEGDFHLKKMEQSTYWIKLFKDKDYTVTNISKPIQHQLSHQIIFTTFIHILSSKVNDDKLIKIDWKDFDIYPVPRLIEKYISHTIRSI